MFFLNNKNSNDLSRELYLSTEKTTGLKQTVANISSFQLQQQQLYQNISNFFDIHKKVELLKTRQGINLANKQLLTKINKITRRIEEIVRQKSQDPTEIGNLFHKLNKLKKDPLFGQDELSLSLYADLEKLTDVISSIDNNHEMVLVRDQIDLYESKADGALSSMASLQEAWEKGKTISP